MLIPVGRTGGHIAMGPPGVNRTPVETSSHPIETSVILQALDRMPSLPSRRNAVAQKTLVVMLSVIAGIASPASANVQEPAPATAAPAGTPETKYCMRIEAITGTRIEEVKCWTRAEWADQGVDVDKDWPKEGVRTIG